VVAVMAGRLPVPTGCRIRSNTGAVAFRSSPAVVVVPTVEPVTLKMVLLLSERQVTVHVVCFGKRFFE